MPAKFEKIEDAVQALFDSLYSQFLPGGKALNISYTSLGELYEQSVRAMGGFPNPETRDSLNEIAESYLEGAKQRMVANLKHVSTVSSRSKKVDAPVDLQALIEEVIEKATSEVDRIVDTESQRARSVGAWEGIQQAAAQMNIDDPTVFFVVVRDQHLCDECKSIHLLPNGITPRVWKMSEINHDYHDRGDDRPSVSGLHPHCRCSQTILFPGWGFDYSGMVKYISPEYDEFSVQRG